MPTRKRFSALRATLVLVVLGFAAGAWVEASRRPAAGAGGAQVAKAGATPPSAETSAGVPESPTPPTTGDTHLLEGMDPAWWQTVSARLQESEYEASTTEEGLQAPNRAQSFRTCFHREGIEIVPRQEEGVWRFSWQTVRVGRPDVMGEMTPSIPEPQGTRVEYERGDGFREWYENTPHGLEQGFTLGQRLPGSGPVTIVGRIGDGLQANLREGAVDLLDESGACVLRYEKLVVWDAEGEILPSEIMLAGSEVALHFDDENAVYPITIDPLLTTPAWVFEDGQNDSELGASVATAGDVNGDGYSDVIVGAPSYDSGLMDEGRALCFHGSAAGLAAVPAWTADGDQELARFATSVASAGDVNADGFGDVIVGAKWWDNGNGNEGRASVYHGSPTGLLSSPSWTAEGNMDGAEFGTSVATAGDVNGDGYADVIVGAMLYNFFDGEGRAFVYHGSASGLAASPAWTDGGLDLAYFGASVSTAGDVNGDGFADVIVGAPYFEAGYGNGRAYVYHGSAGGLAASPAWTTDGSPQADDGFGSTVANAGDVNGDGYADVIIGSPGYDTGQENVGRVYAYFGSPGGLSSTSSWTVDGDQSYARFGATVATAGDVNGDGFADVIVGAPTYSGGQASEGRAYVYQGSILGPSATATWTVESNAANTIFGTSVATAGDVNGDGFSDVIVGAPEYYDTSREGKALVYLGAPDGLSSASIWVGDGGQSYMDWGWCVATAGDVNGDGYSDLLAVADRFDNGQADEGKVWAYYGSPSGVPFSFSWSAETNQVGAEISAAASAGDVNGDGYSDVVIGSHRHDNGESDEGRIYIYHGSSAGLDASPAYSLESNQSGAWFGCSVGCAGDVNGDGYSDVIVGGDGWDDGHNLEGRAWLFPGGSGGLTTASWAVEGDQESALLGYSVATAGDVNGDGYSDVLVSLPTYDQGEEDEGVVWVFHGSPAGLPAAPSRVMQADQAGATFGNRVATAGDVNGDGFSDVIIGAYRFDNGQIDEGRGFVYHGGASGLSMAPVWTTEPDQASAFLGSSVATAGDVNGDGYSDVIVGGMYYDNGESDEGRVWLYQGSPTGLGGPVWITEGNQPGALYGFSVSTAGDVNGDGFSDIVIGAPGFNALATDDGRLWVYLGNGGDGMHRIRQQLRADLSAPIDIFGRSDSNSAFQLFTLARTPAGRGRVQVQIEVKPAGTPFDGTGLVTTLLVRTGFPGSDGSIATFLETIDALIPATVYHWRLRTVSDSPFFPTSPWLSHPGNAVTEGDVRTGGTAADVVEAVPASNLWLGPSAPNPFRTETRFEYALPEAGRVRLAVYDPQGRVVDEIEDSDQSAGPHVAHWDGRSTRGEDLSSGVYFLRLEIAGQVATQKVVVRS